MRELSKKEQIFVEEYLANGFIASRAYAAAYPNSNTNNSWRKLREPHIKDAIAGRMKERLGDHRELADRTMGKLALIAFAEKGDEDYNTSHQLKALELLQKQLGLQTQHINAHIDAAAVVEINILGDDEDDDQTEHTQE